MVPPPTCNPHCDHLKIPMDSSSWPQGVAVGRKNEKIKIKKCIKASPPDRRRRVSTGKFSGFATTPTPPGGIPMEIIELPRGREGGAAATRKLNLWPQGCPLTDLLISVSHYCITSRLAILDVLMDLTRMTIPNMLGISAHDLNRYQMACATNSRKKNRSSHLRETRLRSWAAASIYSEKDKIIVYTHKAIWTSIHKLRSSIKLRIKQH